MEPEIDLSLKEMQRLTSRLKQSWRAKKRSAKAEANNAYLRKRAIEIGELAPGVEYWIVRNPMSEEADRIREEEGRGELPEGFLQSLSAITEMAGALNGYVAFPKRRAPLKARSMEPFVDTGILDYLPVHGGVTYAAKDSTACVYGFDTCHFNSRHLPIRDRSWIKWQCRVLYDAIQIAAKIEKAYLRAQNEAQRLRLLKPLLNLIPEEDPGTGALIRLMSGNL